MVNARPSDIPAILAIGAFEGTLAEAVVVLQRLGLPDEAVTTVAWADLDRDVEADHLKARIELVDEGLEQVQSGADPVADQQRWAISGAGSDRDPDLVTQNADVAHVRVPVVAHAVPGGAAQSRTHTLIHVAIVVRHWARWGSGHLSST